MKVGLISLGCAKNLVDSEMILGMAQNGGMEIVQSPEEADLIIVNTCGFIEDAKKESIATIKEMHGYHKKLIVAGCYAERYKTKLEREMPFIDRVVTLKDYPHFGDIIKNVMHDDSLKFGPMDYQNRVLATSNITPYLKLSDGCDNRCTYCAIPLIRGGFKSRPFEEVINEAKLLVKNGAKELNLISQDTTRFGSDFNVERRSTLPELIKQISMLEGLMMVRVLYLYPDEITDELLKEIQNNPKVAKYFDIPIQHISSSVLKRMNRRGDKEDLIRLFSKIRSMMPESVLRTTLIVGFPGETDNDFEELKEFVRNQEFDRLGVFAYSKEEDTPAYHFTNQLPDDIKNKRLDQIMQIQKKIAAKKNKAQIGKIHHTVIEAYDETSKFYYGRSYAFAPDDIDGYIVFQSKKILSIGDDVLVKITSNYGYDLIGDAL
ncbi:MAG: 30S ribosomal protein S12 methylthiotransferase RimO [Tenericutes bacterium HGW-Tenericutes-1]|jgi:ribosomal protein S12 methylthiotransferase|nr:MAG: 30S ribosomal protein S12 methylthiotransferase RimO [Tenericutes bacterium HGW-Tenericutes-1]